MRRFMLVVQETCAACDANGNACRLCGGKGYTEGQTDLVAALQELGLSGAMAGQAKAIQELREATAPDRLEEIAHRAVVLAHRDGHPNGGRP